jgi:REP element-mobilizing transposase RayT
MRFRTSGFSCAHLLLCRTNWHALFALRDPWTLPRFIHTIMSFVAARTCTALRANGTDWQDSYYDTHIRTARQSVHVENYIEQNPVTRGLVQQPEQWHFSSAFRTDLVSQSWPWFYD